MEWLTRLWQVVRDVLLTALGLYVIFRQTVAPKPSLILIGAGLALLTPAGGAAFRQISGIGSSSPPAPPEPSPPSSPSPAGRNNE